VLKSRKDNKGNKGKSRVKANRGPSALHYVTETALQQHARLSRLKKPGNGKQTPGVCKETDQRRRKENGTARKWIKKLEHGYK
jgi:hypothetical protein